MRILTTGQCHGIAAMQAPRIYWGPRDTGVADLRAIASGFNSSECHLDLASVALAEHQHSLMTRESASPSASGVMGNATASNVLESSLGLYTELKQGRTYQQAQVYRSNLQHVPATSDAQLNWSGSPVCISTKAEMAAE